MRLNDFSKLITQHEGLKVQVNIAQIKEILRIINSLLGGCLYRAIREKE